MKPKLLLFVAAISLLVYNIVSVAHTTEPVAVHLAEGGKALKSVIVSVSATEATKTAAIELADYLGRISGAKFEVEFGDGLSGIAVGRASDFPSLNLAKKKWNPQASTQREDYLLRSHAHGLHVVGSSDLAVSHAVWDLLYRLGYRQFFPGKHWEISPHSASLHIAINVSEHPDYYSRRIWYGHGLWDYNVQPYTDWCRKNRVKSGINLKTGHAYGKILGRNKAIFDEHPEFLCHVDGKRQPPKFDIANPKLRQVVIEDALRQFENNTDLDSISMEPSDGGGWCEDEKSARPSSITDQALYLANEVATAVNAKYPGKLIGMYAYNYHSSPPNIRAHPQVVISVATAFLRYGNTLDDIINGWSAKTSQLGIREYYSVNTWDRDMPARARGGNLDYLKETIPEFNAKGARFFSAESSDNWGPNGLGYYLAARMLWDVNEAQNTAALVEDFLARAFGPAKEPMRDFYRQLDGSKPHLIVADQLGRMFRALYRARQLAYTPDIHARLDDLVLYARYVDLYLRYEKARGPARQRAFETLIRHAYQMRTTMMVHTKALYRDLARRDKSVSIPSEAEWNVPDDKNPWKFSQTFTGKTLANYLAEGIRRYPLTKMDFQPVIYSDDLVGTNILQFPDMPAGKLGASRGKQIFYTRVEQAPTTLELLITGGLIPHYRDRGNVVIDLWKLGGPSSTEEIEKLVMTDRSVPPDGNVHNVKLTVEEPGLYKLTVSDGRDRTRVKWNSSLPLTIKSTLEEPMNLNYSAPWDMYFYVPKSTKVIGLFGGKDGEVIDSLGRHVFSLKDREPNYYSFAVPDGENGKLWRIHNARRSVMLLTVPPYFSRQPSELLLPKEVVLQDSMQ